MHRRAGFSLAEFVIATTIVAVAASVAIPAATSRRILANEACAVVALRDIASAQAKFQAAKFTDDDEDGVGEYGLLRELTGAMGPRQDADASRVGARLDPPLLPRTFGASGTWYEVSRAGYQFRVFLPGAGGIGVAEMTSGALGAGIDADLAETTWGCYAWPQRYGRTGSQTFFTNQTGDIVATDSVYYSGSQAFVFINSGSAFAAPGYGSQITGQLAIGTVGRDGNLWRLVTPRAERDLVSRATFDRGSLVRGSLEITLHESATRTYETLLFRVGDLRPDTRYSLEVGRYPEPRFHRTFDANGDGLATLRFDSRFHPHPRGRQSLSQLVGTEIGLWARGASVASTTVSDFDEVDQTVALASRNDANEATAIATLREIAAAQTQFRAANDCDVNNDGVGEYGLLRELTGGTGVRNIADASTQGTVIHPPLLSDAFRVVNSNSEVVPRATASTCSFLAPWALVSPRPPVCRRSMRIWTPTSPRRPGAATRGRIATPRPARGRSSSTSPETSRRRM